MYDTDKEIEHASEDGYNKWRPMLPWACAFLFIAAIIMIIQYPESNNNTYTPYSYYIGEERGQIDPQEMYKYLNKTVLETAACRTEMVVGEHPVRLDTNVTWIIDNDERVLNDTSVDNAISALGTADSELYYKPFRDGDFIISPVSAVFLNSNSNSTLGGRTDIELRCGSKYKLVFEDVECWWCHIGKDLDSGHTKVYGAGGAKAQVNAGRVIGQAKSSTRVKMYMRQSEDDWVAFDFAKYLKREF